MKTAIVTGSLGLVGSHVSQVLAFDGYRVVGIDNDLRSHLFADVSPLSSNDVEKLNTSSCITKHYSVDIRDNLSLSSILHSEISSSDVHIIVHCAAQPSHDWAASDPLTDLNINLLGTVNILEILRNITFQGLFVFLSTNKVYGDTPNHLPLIENEHRYELDESHHYFNGIDTSMSIDHCLHSVFGCSKASADLYVQEYARYFGLKTIILRGGCLTGSRHRGAKLHGFLSYLVKSAVYKLPYTIFGYKGKQVRDNLHAHDIGLLILRFCHYYSIERQSSDFPVVANLGGGRENSLSVLEAINLLRDSFDLSLDYSISNDHRIGDHIWYISDISMLQSKYKWSPTFSIFNIFEDIIKYS